MFNINFFIVLYAFLLIGETVILIFFNLYSQVSFVKKEPKKFLSPASKMHCLIF